MPDSWRGMKMTVIMMTMTAEMGLRKMMRYLKTRMIVFGMEINCQSALYYRFHLPSPQMKDIAMDWQPWLCKKSSFVKAKLMMHFNHWFGTWTEDDAL